MSERYALLESADEIQFVWDQATVVTVFEMNGTTMLNVAPTRALAHTRTEPPCVCGRLFSVRQARGHHPLRPTGHQALKRLRVRQESSHTFPPPRPVHLSIPQSKPPPALTR